MVMRSFAVCLVALALLGSFCDAQWGSKPASPSRYQKPAPVRQEPAKQMPQHPVQVKQSFEKPLTWTYPEDPQPDPQVDVPFELSHPVPADTVTVECRERDAHVEVKKDMFMIGQLINPADLTLGNCGAMREDSTGQALIFEPELHECGSTSAMTADALIYTFTLLYNPQTVGDSPVVRTSKAAVIVECHYPRNHNVSSLPLDPLWVPFSAVKVAEEFVYFSLKLMTEDWQYERPRHEFFLGDLIRIEAVAKEYFHVPLRVYVDSCVATLTSDPTSTPRYAFIENHGCLVDARITGSNSRFMARSAENKLQFQLEAFRFQGADSGLLHITCHLKATTASFALDSEHRACSYVNGWKEASGANGVCDSCESGTFGPVYSPGNVAVVGTSTGSGSGAAGSSSGGYGGSSSSSGGYGGAGSSFGGYGGGGSPYTPGRKTRDVSKTQTVEWEESITIGPFEIKEKVIG